MGKVELSESQKKSVLTAFEARGFKVEFTEKYVILTKGKTVKKIPNKVYSGLFKIITGDGPY
jgi:hypothetical protein